MSDKILRTRRIPNEDRLEAIIALLRAEAKAWREYSHQQAFRCATGSCQRHTVPREESFTKALQSVNQAVAATDAAKILEDK